MDTDRDKIKATDALIQSRLVTAMRAELDDGICLAIEAVRRLDTLSDFQRHHVLRTLLIGFGGERAS